MVDEFQGSHRSMVARYKMEVTDIVTYGDRDKVTAKKVVDRDGDRKTGCKVSHTKITLSVKSLCYLEKIFFTDSF